MAGLATLGYLKAKHIQIPSNQMVIRRYKKPNLCHFRSFFEDGLFCRHLPCFDDDSEGVVDDPLMDDTLKAAISMNIESSKQPITDKEYKQYVQDFHDDARQKHFANCWRLGTDEHEDIWHNYTENDEGNQGYAIETTVGEFIGAIPTQPSDPEFYDQPSFFDIHETDTENLHAGATHHDLRVGAVWYQNREEDHVRQPELSQDSINFYKRKKFDYEQEFRFLMNPFDTSVSLATTPSGKPAAPVPNIDTHYRYFPIETRDIVDKIVMSPKSSARLPNEIVDVLDDLEIPYQFDKSDGIDIVDSQLSGCTLDKTHKYGAEFGGTANYEGTTTHLNQIRDNFLEETEPSTWPAVDLVQLNSEGDNTVIEAYRHPTADPDIAPDEYGHNDFQTAHTYRIPGNPSAKNYLETNGFDEDDVNEY